MGEGRRGISLNCGLQLTITVRYHLTVKGAREEMADVDVRLEDQQKINEFGRLNNRCKARPPY